MQIFSVGSLEESGGPLGIKDSCVLKNPIWLG